MGADRRTSHGAPSRRAPRGQPPDGTGSPRLASLAYFALGPDAEQAARGYLTDYYRFIGEFAERIADTALTTPDAVERDLKAFAAAGCDELIFFPCSAALDQVERLAEVAGLR